MTHTFSYKSRPATIIFGEGKSREVRHRIQEIGCAKALVLSTSFQASDASKLAEELDSLCVGIFTEAAMHTPVEVTEKAVSLARLSGVDCLVGLGGGSTVGLSKAISLRTDLPQIVIPTTYAGSEVTPILGQTEDGVKTTLKDDKILPGTVIYDPSLTLGLPIGMSATSGLNAMAHAIEALYAQDRNPIATMMAIEGLRAFGRSLPAIVNDPLDNVARSDALYGAWLCGSVLGQVGMALHHKICHTLGGSFDTPHAETHSIMLPHTIGFNAATVPDLLAPVAKIFGTEGGPGESLYDFAASLGAPTSLRDLGLSEGDLDKAAVITVQNPYWNPRTFDQSSIRSMLQNAWEGVRPKN
jgi:maleylacetate reductase